MKFPCMKQGCDLFALRDSAYCERHQSVQEIEDRHGPKIEEAAKYGVAEKVFARADKEDDLAIAYDFQEKEGTEQSIDRTARELAESEQLARQKKPEVYKDAYLRTRADLLAAPHVPLMVAQPEIFTLNGVCWFLKQGLNSVPVPIKKAYDDRQNLINNNELLQRLLTTESAGAEGHPSAYYDDVLTRGYRGEVTPSHDRRSKL